MSLSKTCRAFRTNHCNVHFCHNRDQKSHYLIKMVKMKFEFAADRAGYVSCAVAQVEFTPLKADRFELVVLLIQGKV